MNCAVIMFFTAFLITEICQVTAANENATNASDANLTSIKPESNNTVNETSTIISNDKLTSITPNTNITVTENSTVSSNAKLTSEKDNENIVNSTLRSRLTSDRDNESNANSTLRTTLTSDKDDESNANSTLRTMLTSDKDDESNKSSTPRTISLRDRLNSDENADSDENPTLRTVTTDEDFEPHKKKIKKTTTMSNKYVATTKFPKKFHTLSTKYYTTNSTDEYTTTESSVTESTTVSPKNVFLPKECGRNRYYGKRKDKKKVRIIAGEQAPLGQVPWIARIGLKMGASEAFYCAGSIINKHYVVTAAHCEELQGNIIRVGENYLKTNIDCDVAGTCAPPHQDIKVKRWMMANFCNIDNENDYAMIELAKPVEFNEFVQPVCFPRRGLTTKDLSDEAMTISGWGLINARTQAEPDYLMFITAPLVKRKKCMDLYDCRMLENQLCIGYTRGKDTCNGDSGGPVTKTLNVDGEKRTYLIGVVSYGLPDCGNGPAVYTNVSYYRSWTLKRINKS